MNHEQIGHRILRRALNIFGEMARLEKLFHRQAGWPDVGKRRSVHSLRDTLPQLNIFEPIGLALIEPIDIAQRRVG